MDEIRLSLTFMRSTKGTHVYGDDKDAAILPSVYIKKAGLPEKPPEKLEIVIRSGEK